MARTKNYEVGRTWGKSDPTVISLFACELAGRRGRRVDSVLDLVVPVVQRSAEQRRAGDGHEADERREQRVLDEVLALFITNETANKRSQIIHVRVLLCPLIE